MKKRKVLRTNPIRKYIIISLFVFFVIGIGYSVLSTDLNIASVISIDKYDQTLYGVLEKAAKKGTYAQEYTGAHQDSMNELLSTKKIYYWFASNTNVGNEIFEMNNVLFGGFCWQMYRTTDTGGVRLIYNGTPNNGVCNRTGSGQQIGTSKFNDNYDNPANLGYMYNKEYHRQSIHNSADVYGSANLTSSSAYKYFYYADEIVWDSNSSTWELVNPYYVDSINSVKGKYTFLGSAINGSNVYYIAGGTTTRLAYIQLSDGHDLSYYNWPYTYSDSYIDNGNGTYSLVNPQTLSRIDYYSNASTFKTKYICINATNNICDEVRYVNSFSQFDYSYVTTNNTFKYASGFTYNESNNTYQLNNDVVYVWDYMDANERAKLKNYHYTFYSDAIESSNINYTFAFYNLNEELSYISLSDGESIEDALNNMLYSDNVNQNDSIIKQYIENWYQNNLNSYSNYLEDTIFCYSREQSNSDKNGWNPNNGDLNTEINFNNSTIQCSYETDKFSVSNAKAKLKYPIGLPSTREFSLNGEMDALLFKTGSSYWSGTPSNYNQQYPQSGANLSYIYTNGYIYNGYASYSLGVRPVVSLKPGTEYTSGDGSKNNPYIVG